MGKDHRDEQHSRTHKHALTRDYVLERKTGFEPATLTLAR